MFAGPATPQEAGPYGLAELGLVNLENLHQVFVHLGGNISLQFGPPSGGLLDLDLDCREARELAPHFLPDTDAVFGRKSAPASHWLFVSDLWQSVEKAVVKFDDPNPSKSDDEHGVGLLELRVGRVELDKKGVERVVGAQTIAPPSTHPSGERVRWERDGEPAYVEAQEVLRCVRELAAATLLARRWPTGRRHDAALVLGGWLARAGWDEPQIAHFVEAVAKVAGDDEWFDRVRAAVSAVARLREGKKVAGSPRMKEEFGAPIVDALASWLDVKPSPEEAQPVEQRKPTPPPAQPCNIRHVRSVFRRWLLLKDPTSLYATVGTVAANLLPGDPVWLGIVAPPSSAKTEILNSLSQLPFAVKAGTLTLPALLSGTPKKQLAKDASGGLLRQVGEFGVLVCKDFGSILSSRPDVRAEVLAALREIFDGSWKRMLGTDGGKSLEWTGKLGLVFGCTPMIDQHQQAIGTMGDRFLMCRLMPDPGQLTQALKHSGAAAAQMRTELAEAVAGLFASELREPRPLDDKEIQRLVKITDLAVRLRGSVVRHSHTREIENILGVEGTGRLGLTLERLLAGLDSLGLDRQTAFQVIERVTFDSVPPWRLKAYRFLRHERAEFGCQADTRLVANSIGVSTATARRVLEDLAAYGVVERIIQGAGRPDLWRTWPWGRRPRRRTT